MSNEDCVLQIYSIYRPLNKSYKSCLEDASSWFCVWTSKYLLRLYKGTKSTIHFENVEFIRCPAIAVEIAYKVSLNCS
jgi:hypothetical protein